MTSSPGFDVHADLSPDRAARIATMVLSGVNRDWPYAPHHLWAGPHDGLSPRALHPIFSGCFDWHSAVHGHWCLARLHASGRIDSGMAEAARSRLCTAITPEAVAVEAAYFDHQLRRGFEWPYGWAWLLQLAAELAWSGDAALRAAGETLRPLADLLADRVESRLARMIGPVRVGTHTNSAFALELMWDAAPALRRDDLRAAIDVHARRFFADDRDYPWAYEPSAYDFLSPGLTAAGLMQRVLDPNAFADWLGRYCPRLPERPDRSLALALSPVACPDLADGHLSHLVGLNLSRAWGLERLSAAIPVDSGRRALLAQADMHRAAGLADACSGHYAGDHWLGTFVIHLLTHRPGIPARA